VRHILRDLDVFDKTDHDELQQRSRLGSIITLVTTMLSLLGLLVHFVIMFRPLAHRELLFEPTINDEDDLVNISLSIEVDLPCYFLHVDSLDRLGLSQFNINTTITLRRISARGAVIGVANASLADNCQPCYGLKPEGQCSSSCEELIVLSMFQGRKPSPDTWSQCGDAIAYPADISLGERCLVKGKITARKAPGGFHIARGRNMKGSSVHRHDMVFQLPDSSFRRKIQKLRFGDKILTTSVPLENLVKNENVMEPAMYRYNLIITPVILYQNRALKAKGFEYTALQTGWTDLPGLFF
jgi:hypothetical protein